MTRSTLGEAIDHVSAGDTVYLGGFGYNQPFAVAHELIRRGVDDLRVVRPSGDILLDQLVGAGLVAETVTSHCWNAIGPSPTHAFRRAVEDGDPRPLQVAEFGLGDLVLRFFAGARGLPFVPAAPPTGTGQFEQAAGRDAFASVTVDGASHHVMDPLAPDVGCIHVHRADEQGNAQLRGPLAELPDGPLACETVIVTAEEIVPTETIRATPELTVLPAVAVDAVVECPGGAHPSGVIGRYERDVAYLQAYTEWTETAAGFEEFLQTWVYDVSDRSAYRDLATAEGFGDADPAAATSAPDPASNEPPTRREQLLYVAAREFTDEAVAFTGFHWPVVAARVARHLHAPTLTSIFEAGIAYGGPSDRLPTSTTEVGVFEGHAEWYGSSLDTLRTLLQSGRLDAALVDAANVDRFGNINSSVVGGYETPDVRLPGPGGAKDILTYGSDVTLICGSTDPRRYHDRVEYITSPGHIDGDGSRRAAGFPPETGPSSLLTPLGRFVFDETGRARLDALARNVTVAEVRETTGWDVTDGAYGSLPVPSGEDLQVVRSVMREASERGYRAVRP